MTHSSPDGHSFGVGPGPASASPGVLLVIWDWNGTLLDDTDASVAALNGMLRRRGLKSVTRAEYRERFAFPVRPYYAALGMDLAHEDWDAVAREYHAAYAVQPKRLNAEAVAALDALRRAGARQVLLSASRQDLLEADVVRHGLADRFERVAGTDNLDGASKLDVGRALMASLVPTLAPGTRVVMVGDALHDKEVADALGVGCVLCAQGGHAAHRLRRVAPTGDTLSEAVSLVRKFL